MLGLYEHLMDLQVEEDARNLFVGTEASEGFGYFNP